MGKICVIVPVYQAEQYLERCINSILSQSFSDFDLILIDDGSSDRCPMMCESYSEKDRRVQVIHQKNRGLSAARNVGIRRALRGGSRWITFVDADDWIHSDYLKRLYDAAISADADISVCGFAKKAGETAVAVAPPKAEPIRADALWQLNTSNATVAWGKLYRKDLFKRVRYPVGHCHEDEYVTYKMLFAAERIVYDAAPLYCYFQNPNGIMNSPWKPERMHAIEALNLQIVYFRKRGYPQFCERRWRFMCTLIRKHNAILEEQNRPLKERRWLRRQVRYAYRKNREAYGLSLENNFELFKIAFPARLNFYRKYCAIFNKKKFEELEKLYAEQN